MFPRVYIYVTCCSLAALISQVNALVLSREGGIRTTGRPRRSFLASPSRAGAFACPRSLRRPFPSGAVAAVVGANGDIIGRVAVQGLDNLIVNDSNNNIDDDPTTMLIPESRWECPVHHDVCQVTGVTLTRYMMELARLNPELLEVESIVTSLQVACKTLSSLVRTAPLTGLTGLQGGGGSINVQGEEQKKLDVLANDVLKRALGWTGKLGTIASEEEDSPVSVLRDNRGNPVYSSDVVVNTEGTFVAVFDPLDGSSNVDAGIPVGTIFGIFEQTDDCQVELGDTIEDNERRCLQDTLQPGKNLVAAGYCLYSSATTLVMTLGNGVNGFTLDERIGEFVLTHPNITIPSRGKIYSFNEANRWDWDQPLQSYITDIQQGNGDTKSRYSSRYIGSMAADVHRTLLYGGIFGYPADKKNPDGKLRLLYEAAPMAFLVEQAGGLALTGKSRILNIPPVTVHQRVPCILGSRDDVRELRRYYEASHDPDLIARCEARLKFGTGDITTAVAANPADNKF